MEGEAQRGIVSGGAVHADHDITAGLLGSSRDHHGAGCVRGDLESDGAEKQLGEGAAADVPEHEYVGVGGFADEDCGRVTGEYLAGHRYWIGDWLDGGGAVGGVSDGLLWFGQAVAGEFPGGVVVRPSRVSCPAVTVDDAHRTLAQRGFSDGYLDCRQAGYGSVDPDEDGWTGHGWLLWLRFVVCTRRSSRIAA
ncbi:hypothetical protein Aau02nite_90970 [Amorphoplanes auranticolor]|uniref:Uncharacterized protein n=1 Tax=Actinoplanes auranticolor TaxID=47988 RepID=A0A919T036_9ACTN|nr:hypothetical protein Aau02nite_90970 [Actinoplanes auranticolor]